MKEADVILTPLPQADGAVKNRRAPQNILGAIGQVAASRHTRLLKNLSEHLVANVDT